MAALLERLALAESPSLEPAAQARAVRDPRGRAQPPGLRGRRRCAAASAGDHLQAAPAGADPARRSAAARAHGHRLADRHARARCRCASTTGACAGPGVVRHEGRARADGVRPAGAARPGLEPPLRRSCSSTPTRRSAAATRGAHPPARPGRGARVRARALVRARGQAEDGAQGRRPLHAAHQGPRQPRRAQPRGRASSAILEASHQVQRLFALNDPERGVTVNVGTIDGGLRPNVVAPEVTRGGRRPRPHGERRARGRAGDPRADARRRTASSIEVEGGFGRPPLERTRAQPRAVAGRPGGGARRSAWSSTRRPSAGPPTGTSPASTPRRWTGWGRSATARTPPTSTSSSSQMPERAALLACCWSRPRHGRADGIRRPIRLRRASSPASRASPTSPSGPSRPEPHGRVGVGRRGLRARRGHGWARPPDRASPAGGCVEVLAGDVARRRPRAALRHARGRRRLAGGRRRPAR